ncbi:MAG TPA: cytochrome c-type biogenesis protein CcmH, partial [Dehalococcoidia bacterium]|nr:cytochrome c-type biogenesis protein CcmH [Dehalococcoidia bacterium]
MLKWALPALLALGLLLNPWPIHVHADGPPTVHQVASGLMCQCGCGLTVASCQESMTCTVANGIVQQIQRQIDEGKSKQEIQEYFVSIYGEQILAL